MKNNLFIKILCSVPVILVVLYFIPFLGICLLLFRRFVYQNKTIKTYPIYLRTHRKDQPRTLELHPVTTLLFG